MTPLRDAVRFVDRDQRKPARRQQHEAALGEQALGRHIEQIQLAAARAGFYLGNLGPAQRRIEKRGPHAELRERSHLILHERDERRHHHARSLSQQRGNLIAQ